MAKKDIDWGKLGFGYSKTDYRYVSNFKDGAWDDGALTTDDMVVCADLFRGSESLYNRRRPHRYFPPGLKRRAYDGFRSTP